MIDRLADGCLTLVVVFLLLVLDFLLCYALGGLIRHLFFGA